MIFEYDIIIWIDNMMKNKKIEELEKVFQIFANRHRLAILIILKLEGEKSVGQIADRLEMPFNTTSKNLLFLTRSGILKRRYDGPFVLYSIARSLLKLADLILKSFSKKRE
jgi:DNA-binding transcriptional ArsR family regulator